MISCLRGTSPLLSCTEQVELIRLKEWFRNGKGMVFGIWRYRLNLSLITPAGTDLSKPPLNHYNHLHHLFTIQVLPFTGVIY